MERILGISKALGDESRLRAVAAISQGELCLCQLIELLGLAPSTVSKHLTILQSAGLVERRKEGRWSYYRLPETATSEAARGALDWALGSLGASPRIQADAAELERVRGADLGELSACYRD